MMDRKYLLMLILVIAMVVIVSTVYLFYFKTQPPSLPLKYSPETYVTLLDECSLNKADEYNEYIICCERDSRIYDCSNKQTFIFSEFITIKVNLTKVLESKSIAHVPYNPFYACAYTNIIELPDGIPSHYSDKNLLLAESGKELVGCSQKFFLNETHVMTDAGFIPDLPNVKIAEIRIFPEHDYKTLDDFAKYFNESMLVFNLTKSVSKLSVVK